MERLIASANENNKIESYQVTCLRKIFIYTLSEESRSKRIMPSCLKVAMQSMKNFPWCPDIQEYGCGILSNATLTANSPSYSISNLKIGIKLVFDAITNHNLGRGVIQNATHFLMNVSQKNIFVIYTEQPEARINSLCAALCGFPDNRSTQEYCLNIIIRTCEDPTLCSYVRKYFEERQDLLDDITSLINAYTKDMDSNLFSLLIMLVLILSDEQVIWDKLTNGGEFASLLINALTLPWMENVLATKIFSVLLKMCYEWELCKNKQPSILENVSEPIFSILCRCPRDQRIQEWGCAVLEGLSNCRMPIISSLGQAETAVKLLYSNKENPTTIKSYFSILWSAVHRKDDLKLMLDAAGIIKAVTSAMKAYPEDIEMQIQGSGLIASLFANKEIVSRALRSKWTCELSQVFYAMKKFSMDPSMQVTGMEVLCNTIACNPDIYFTCESMKIAVLNLGKFCDDLRIVSTALTLLRNLSYQDSLDQRFLKFGGLVAVVGVIRMNHLSSVCPHALSVLSVILGSKHCANAFVASWPGLLPLMLKRASSGFYQDDGILISSMRCVLKIIQVIGVTTKSTVDTLINIFRSNMDKFQVAYLCCQIFETLAHYDAFVKSPSKDAVSELISDATIRWIQSEALQDMAKKFADEISREEIVASGTNVAKKQNRGMKYISFKTLGDVTEFVSDKPAGSTLIENK